MKTIHIKSWVLAIVFASFVGGTITTIATPQASYAASNYTCSGAPKLLTLPPWYRGLTVSDSDCALASPDAVGGISVFIWRIVLNALDIALQLVGYIAAGFILFGGFQFMTAAGEVQKAADARQTIINAAIGIAISVGSVGLVNLIFGIIK